MAVDGARVGGLDHLKAQLAALPKVMRRRVLRNALAAGARIVRDDARRNAPVLTVQNSLRAPYRQPATVKKAITVRTSRRDRREGNVGVFVNVRPAKAGQRGAKSKTDPFYWRWLEFGWTPASGPRKGGVVRRRKARLAGNAPSVPGRKFLSGAADKLGEALSKFESEFGRWINKVAVSGRVTD